MPAQSEQRSTADHRPPIILIHGFRGSPIGLKAIADHLRAAGYDVRVPAIPPFAGAKPLEAYDPENYAKFILEYIRQNELDRPVLVGHSMGSIIAAATAELHPDALANQLVLLSPISTKPAKFFASLTPLSALLPCSLVDYITTRYLFVPKDRTLFRETMDLTHRCSSDQPPTKSTIFAAAKFSAGHCVADFDFIKHTLIIAGAKDRLIKQSATRQLADRLNAKTIFLEGSGHLHNYEQPAATAAAILDFLHQT